MTSQVSRKIAFRYANALFSLAKEEGEIAAVEADLAGLCEMISQSDMLTSVLMDGYSSRVDIEKVVQALLEKGKASDIFKRFCNVLNEKNRVKLLPEIGTQFEMLVAEDNNEIEAEVTSAVPLTDVQEKKIILSLGETLAKKIRIKKIINPSIYGGLMIRVGSKMFDSSLASKLERLGKESKKIIATL